MMKLLRRMKDKHGDWILNIKSCDLCIKFKHWAILAFPFTHCTKNKSFLLRISSVNVTKSAVFCGFDHIYWRNP